MSSNESNSAAPARRPLWRRLLMAGLPVLVLIAAIALALVFMSSRPTAQRHKTDTPAQARLVTVTPAEAAPQSLMISANGTVEAAQSTQLRARVSGQVVSLQDNLAPGTRFEKGEVLAHIDDSDYQIALNQAKTQLADAKASLATENGQQAVAKRELDLVGSENVSEKERNLALRGPQLAQAKANVESARSDVAQARLNLERTRVRAPFNGIVTSRSASVGDVVSSSETLATLAATDNYWVDLSLPVDQLRWIHAAGPSHDTGTDAQVYYPDAWGDDAYLKAHVLRIQASLEDQGRLARVLLTVPDPLGDQTSDGHSLLLGAYVNAELAAAMPSGSVVVDSAFVRENNHVWVMSDQDTLDIRKVKIAYRDSTRAVISAGLQPGDEVVTSDLSAPIQDMPIRVASDTQNMAQAKSKSDDHPAQADPKPNDNPPQARAEPAPATKRRQQIAARLALAPAFTRLSQPASERRS